MVASNRDLKAERRPRSERSLRIGAAGVGEASPRAVCRVLNRLIVAGRNESMVLAAGARIVGSAERRGRLRAQVERRAIFRWDLTAAVTALGGVPARHAAGAAMLAAGARRIHQILMGPHQGDAYAACARATETTANAYAKALTLRLPLDVRFGVECQSAEVEWDRGELWRLRWGAALTPLSGRSVARQTEDFTASASNEVQDARALEVWSDEGGPSLGTSGAEVTQ